MLKGVTSWQVPITTSGTRTTHEPRVLSGARELVTATTVYPLGLQDRVGRPDVHGCTVQTKHTPVIHFASAAPDSETNRFDNSVVKGRQRKNIPRCAHHYKLDEKVHPETRRPKRRQCVNRVPLHNPSIIAKPSIKHQNRWFAVILLYCVVPVDRPQPSIRITRYVCYRYTHCTVSKTRAPEFRAAAKAIFDTSTPTDLPIHTYI